MTDPTESADLSDVEIAQHLIDSTCHGHDGALGGGPMCECADCLTAALARVRAEERDRAYQIAAKWSGMESDGTFVGEEIAKAIRGSST